MATKKRETRYRDFATEIWPDSALDDWLDILKRTHVQSFVILHDKDVNPDGTLKKPHYHVMIMFDSVKTKEQAKEFVARFGGVGLEVLSTKRGMARYLCHMDNPEKYQYDYTDVIQLGGADYIDVCTNESDNFSTFREIVDYVSHNEIEDVISLFEILLDNDQKDWLHFLYKNAFLVDKFCSANYKRRVYGKESPKPTTVIDMTDEMKTFMYKMIDYQFDR